jgi:hypothetical protein
VALKHRKVHRHTLSRSTLNCDTFKSVTAADVIAIVDIKILSRSSEMPNSTRKRPSLSRLLIVFGTTVCVLAFTFLCVFAAPLDSSSANCISVRVFDAKSGKPTKGLLTSVVIDNYRNFRIGETNENGVVQFCPKDPVPTSFTLDFRYFYQTDAEVHFNTESVLKTGSVAQNARNKGKFHDREAPKPGEIVVFGKRWWPIDRWLDRRLGEWP